jgi:hypothetical protein
MPKPKKATEQATEPAGIERADPAKMKKGFDLDGGDSFGTDKGEDSDVLATDPEEGEDSVDGADLDNEEVDPFGDKWEE